MHFSSYITGDFTITQVLEISAVDYVEKVNKAGPGVWVYLHLYKQGVPLCALINQHLPRLAAKFPKVLIFVIEKKCLRSMYGVTHSDHVRLRGKDVRVCWYFVLGTHYNGDISLIHSLPSPTVASLIVVSCIHGLCIEALGELGVRFCASGLGAQPLPPLKQ